MWVRVVETDSSDNGFEFSKQSSAELALGTGKTLLLTPGLCGDKLCFTVNADLNPPGIWHLGGDDTGVVLNKLLFVSEIVLGLGS